ncbi:MAG: polyprenyl synthetase family protein [Clostridia bacterium]|nr:polyprenyl synthetase family protein [Clostridia bacterium]
MDYSQQFQAYLELINQYLKQALENITQKNIVSEAMEYSLMNAGKRVRPVLALAFCDMLGGDVQTVLPYACAIEMIHTYSLIHDDLPCMDDDDLRRGKPSCHKAFGEAYALLAGDALLNLAYETIFACSGDCNTAVRCGREVSAAAGIGGMIGGQTMDLLSEGKHISLEKLKQLHALKTGALLTAPCKVGVIAAGGTQADEENARQFGAAIGLQFQILDDILDVTSTDEVLGKPIGSDEQNHKSTYVSLLGLQQAKQAAQALKEQALALLEPYGDSAWFLKEMTEELTTRTK